MIQRQLYKTRVDGVNLYVTFSDEGWKIRKKGNRRGSLYNQAVDVEGANYEYEEADEKVMHTAEEAKWMDENGVQYYIR
jgi:hypothetical protein